MDSGVYVHAGDEVIVEGQGSIYVAEGSSPISADGVNGTAGSSYVAPGLRSYSLVGRIGNSGWFQLGTCSILTAGTSGELILAVNDEWFVDNSGYWNVEISIVSCAQKTIRVLSPNGGENWLVGTWYSAQFTAGSKISQADVCISEDGGNSWVKIGRYNLDPSKSVHSVPLMPEQSDVSDRCLIGVGDSSTWNGHGYDVWDQSDGAFRVNPPASMCAVSASAPAGHGSVSPTSKSAQAGGSVDITICLPTRATRSAE